MRKRNWIYGFLLILLFKSLFGQQYTDIEQLYQSALENLHQKKWTEAKSIFEDILTLAPKHAESYFHLGKIYLELNDEKKAEVNLKKAITYNPAYDEAHHQLALLYMSWHTLEGRIRAYKEMQKALRYDPKNIEYQLNLAELYLRMEMESKAKTVCKRGIKQYPNATRAYLILAKIAEMNMLQYRNIRDKKLGGTINFSVFAETDMPEAMEILNQVIKLDPKNIGTFHRLAWLYFEIDSLEAMKTLLD